MIVEPGERIGQVELDGTFDCTRMLLLTVQIASRPTQFLVTNSTGTTVKMEMKLEPSAIKHFGLTSVGFLVQ